MSKVVDIVKVKVKRKRGKVAGKQLPGFYYSVSPLLVVVAQVANTTTASSTSF